MSRRGGHLVDLGMTQVQPTGTSMNSRVVGEGSRHGGPRGIGAGLAAQHEQVLGHGHRVKPMVSWPMLALMQPMQRHWAKASFWG